MPLQEVTTKEVQEKRKKAVLADESMSQMRGCPLNSSVLAWPSWVLDTNMISIRFISSIAELCVNKPGVCRLSQAPLAVLLHLMDKE